jgi:hypothetical protein
MRTKAIQKDLVSSTNTRRFESMAFEMIDSQAALKNLLRTPRVLSHPESFFSAEAHAPENPRGR